MSGYCKGWPSQVCKTQKLHCNLHAQPKSVKTKGKVTNVINAHWMVVLQTVQKVTTECSSKWAIGNAGSTAKQCSTQNVPARMFLRKYTYNLASLSLRDFRSKAPQVSEKWTLLSLRDFRGKVPQVSKKWTLLSLRDFRSKAPLVSDSSWVLGALASCVTLHYTCVTATISLVLRVPLV